MLIGHVGKDPEVKSFDGGNKNASFSLATSKTYKDKSGEKKTDTTWHNIVVWGKLAEIIEKYVKKGSKIYVEGEIKNRSYEKDGQTKYISEIVASSMEMLGEKSDSSHTERTTSGKEKSEIQTMSDESELPMPDDGSGLPF